MLHLFLATAESSIFFYEKNWTVCWPYTLTTLYHDHHVVFQFRCCFEIQYDWFKEFIRCHTLAKQVLDWSWQLTLFHKAMLEDLSIKRRERRYLIRNTLHNTTSGSTFCTVSSHRYFPVTCWLALNQYVSFDACVRYSPLPCTCIRAVQISQKLFPLSLTFSRNFTLTLPTEEAHLVHIIDPQLWVLRQAKVILK